MLKKIFYFLKSFSYISGNETLHFSAQAPKIKKTTQRKLFIFQETETPKIYFILENGNPKKLFTFQETELFYTSRKVYSEPWHKGTFLYFRKGIFRTLTYLEQEAYSEPWYI